MRFSRRRAAVAARGRELAGDLERGALAVVDGLARVGDVAGLRLERGEVAAERRADGRRARRSATPCLRLSRDEQLQARLDCLEAVGVGLETVGGGAQLQGRFLELHAAAVDQLGGGAEGGRDRCQLAELRRQSGERRDRRRLAGVEHRLAVAADLLRGARRGAAARARARSSASSPGCTAASDELGVLELEQVAPLGQRRARRVRGCCEAFARRRAVAA